MSLHNLTNLQRVKNYLDESFLEWHLMNRNIDGSVCLTRPEIKLVQNSKLTKTCNKV